MVKTSLRKKLIKTTMLTFLAIGAATVSFVGWLQFETSQKHLQEKEAQIKKELFARGEGLTANHTLALKGFVDDMALGSVRDLVSTTVKEDPDIIYGMFVDDSQTPWAFVDPKNESGIVDKGLDWQGKLQLTVDAIENEKKNRTINLYNQEVYEFNEHVLIEDEDVGSIRYGFSTNAMRQALQSAREAAIRDLIKAIVILMVIGGLAMSFSFVITRRQASKITEPLGELSEAADRLAQGDRTANVSINSGDEIEHLASSFNQMVLELKASYENLEQKVADRTSDLKQKTDDIANMLQNLRQGICTIMQAGIIHNEYSKHLEKILGTDDIAGKGFMDLIFANTNLGADTLDRVYVSIDNSLGEDAINFILNGHLLVKEFELTREDGTVCILEADWNPIIDAETNLIEKIMVSLRDVTELRRLQAEMGAQKRQLEMIGQMLAVSTENFEGFLKDTQNFLTRNRELVNKHTAFDDAVVQELFRNMHTIKGNARSYGLLHLNDIVHVIESSYKEMRIAPEPYWHPEELLEDLEKVQSGVDEYISVYEEKLTSRTQSTAGGVSEEFLGDFSQALKKYRANGEDTKMLLSELDQLLLMARCRPLQDAISGVLNSMPEIANTMLKPVPRVVVTAPSLLVPKSIVGVVQNTLMHILRNAVCHGLETAQERIESGKPTEGTIILEATEIDSHLKMAIYDDGRGLNLTKLEEKAREIGKLDSLKSDAQIAELIFESGVSTAEEVTDISGRGVGMDAVRQFLEEMGGGAELELLSGRTADGFCPFKFLLDIPMPGDETSEQA